jgi:putative tricarboxylic transport membrane protein
VANDLRLRSGENWFDWLMMVLSIVVFILAYQISGFASCAPGTFPLVASLTMVISMTLVLLGNRKRPKPQVSGWLEEVRRTINRVAPRVILIYTSIIIAYAFLIVPLHFYPSTCLFLFISMMYLKGVGWLKSLLISIGSLVAVYAIFQFVFKVTLP